MVVPSATCDWPDERKRIGEPRGGSVAQFHFHAHFVARWRNRLIPAAGPTLAGRPTVENHDRADRIPLFLFVAETINVVLNPRDRFRGGVKIGAERE